MAILRIFLAKRRSRSYTGIVDKQICETKLRTLRLESTRKGGE
jgi:hypothetical protein